MKCPSIEYSDSEDWKVTLRYSVRIVTYSFHLSECLSLNQKRRNGGSSLNIHKS